VLPLTFLIYSHGNSIRDNWFVGSIVFFFEHEFNSRAQYLVLVDVARRNSTSDYDKTIPVIELNNKNVHAYAVCRFEDIVASVGLVRCSSSNNRKYKVISHHIFKQELHSSAGTLSRL
jgi:hypothetical protein